MCRPVFMEEKLADFDFDVMDTRTKSESGVEMTVRRIGTTEPLLSKDGKPVTLKVLGPDSETFRSLSREQSRARIVKQATGQPADDDSIDRDTVDILAACTKGWSNVNAKDGTPIPFSADAARDLYRQYPAIRDQVDAFMGARVNFTKASS